MLIFMVLSEVSWGKVRGRSGTIPKRNCDQKYKNVDQLQVFN